MDVRKIKDFPFEIKDVGPPESVELANCFTGMTRGFIRVGPKKYFMPRRYQEMAADIYNMPIRSSDIFIVTYPRSGTTWVSELIYLVANDLDYTKAASASIGERFPFVEFSILIDPEEIKYLTELHRHNEVNLKRVEIMINPITEALARLPSPRFVKSHLPLSLLPLPLLDTARVVYVARDPRDVAVSYYNLCKLFNAYGCNGDFKTYWNYFVNDMVVWSPFFDHVKEAWEKRHHPNMLLLFYEDLIKDLPGGVRQVASFLEKTLSEEQVAKLCDHLSIENFKKNNTVNDTTFRELGFLSDWNGRFIRKGKAGGWRDYFDEEMTQQAERWIADNLRDTDLRFPHLSN